MKEANTFHITATRDLCSDIESRELSGHIVKVLFYVGPP